MVILLKINVDRYRINKKCLTGNKIFLKIHDEKTKNNHCHYVIVIDPFYFCFGSGGLASLGGNAARPTFNAVATWVKYVP